MLCLMYLPTSHICVFASTKYTKNVLQFVQDSRPGSLDTLIDRIVRGENWGDFYRRNNLPTRPLPEEFELANFDIEDVRIYEQFY